jgi:UDPglucose--hexose-1-phosphate uridylyltransferase
MIVFKKAIQEGVMNLNPFRDFAPYESKVETRWDPLTDLTSRIVHFPVRKIGPYDFDDAVRNSLKSPCPFCGENVEKMTAKFDKDRYGFERLERDGVIVIPNILPFDKYCLVAIISKEHFIDLDMLIKNRYLSRAVRVILDVLRVIKGFDKAVKYFSINCNYMPMSGSSLLHPHIQAIAGEFPTNHHGLLLRRSAAFHAEHGVRFWDELMNEEKRLNERYIGDDGRTFWHAPFAPKGNTDLSCIMGKNSIFDLDESDFSSFEEGFTAMLTYLKNDHISGFNFTIFSGIDGEDHFRSNMRIIARRFLPPVNASDTNYFDRIHMENACLFFPEDVAHEARPVWQEFANGKSATPHTGMA